MGTYVFALVIHPESFMYEFALVDIAFLRLQQ